MKKRLLLSSLLLLSAHLVALPEGGEAAAGDVKFTAAERKLTIEASDKAIINYAKFHIGTKEAVEFIQPSSKATVQSG